jgi:hypothetical protein
MWKILFITFLNVVMLLWAGWVVLNEPSRNLHLVVCFPVSIFSAMSVWWLSLGGHWRYQGK